MHWGKGKVASGLMLLVPIVKASWTELPMNGWMDGWIIDGWITNCWVAGWFAGW